MIVHGIWCNARTYPTRCRRCGSEVFYFSCDCGSKVFFDDLGGDWSIHDCVSGIVRSVRINVEEKYARRLAERARRKTWTPPIVALHPAGDEVVEELGIVREVCDVDVYKKFRVPRDGGLAPAFLGPKLVRNDFVQVTVHAGGIAADQTSSYTFLVARGTWKRSGIQQGSLVVFEIRGCRTPRGDRYWEYRRVAVPS